MISSEHALKTSSLLFSLFYSFLLSLTTGVSNNSLYLLLAQFQYSFSSFLFPYLSHFSMRELLSHGVFNNTQNVLLQLSKVQNESCASEKSLLWSSSLTGANTPVNCLSVCWKQNTPLNTLLETGDYNGKAKLALHCC